jgi:outer membrane immunogenic protein
MKKILGLALAGALSVAALPAVAADYPLKAPPPPIWTWTGFYVGVSAGAGWMNGNFVVPTSPISGTGGLVGGTIGANWQMPGSPWVLGIEGDFSWTNLIGTATGCGPNCTIRPHWLATARGRFGHAMGPLLFYVTGGAAFANFTNSCGAPGCATNASATGWTGGGGLEGALGGGWSLKAEYLYVRFDTNMNLCAPAGACAGPPFNIINWNTVQLLRAGLNYKF